MGSKKISPKNCRSSNLLKFSNSRASSDLAANTRFELKENRKQFDLLQNNDLVLKRARTIPMSLCFDKPRTLVNKLLIYKLGWLFLIEFFLNCTFQN